ncbi:DNA primase/helicase [Klebsiella phage vB_KpnS_ZX4]|uniref:DNA primase n=1 Tax=Klebsiella phage vB_KpnS_ZX4 TaxID=2820395 RepID=UPI001B7D4EC2|nr:DNA primase [Klebsiella phage vB_KpnS_ZX4]QTH80004.1 DNA primase/helicase [Klebsiella phage vB_KpnS_ZX4]
MFYWEDIRQRMIGNWEAALLSIVNIDRKVFNGKHQPCPHCMGKDRFRWDNNFETKGDGGAICSQCGNGSGITWLMKLSGMTFPESMEALAGFLNMHPREKLEAIRKQLPKVNHASDYLTEAEVAVIMEKAGGDTITGKTGELVAIPLYMAGTMTPCNVAFMADDETVSFRAGFSHEYTRGRLTRGAVTPIGDKTEWTYLVADYFDAWRAHRLTGAHVWCCWSPENMWEVVRNVSDERRAKLRCIINNNFDEVCAAENAGLPILITDDGRDIRYSGAIRKRLYKPEELFEALKNKPS